MLIGKILPPFPVTEKKRKKRENEGMCINILYQWNDFKIFKLK